MIKAVFFKENGCLSGFSISGHAGYAASGSDIVCAAVSSAAELVCNTITDFFCDDALVTAEDNRLTLILKGSGENSRRLIESFYTHMGFIAEEFPRNINISQQEK